MFTHHKFAGAALTDATKQGPNQQKPVHGSAAWKSKIQVLAQLVPSDSCKVLAAGGSLAIFVLPWLEDAPP